MPRTAGKLQKKGEEIQKEDESKQLTPKKTPRKRRITATPRSKRRRSQTAEVR
jgi:hypothetical protein